MPSSRAHRYDRDPLHVRFLLVLVACSQPPSRGADAPEPIEHDDDRHYAIWFGGARIGTAVERERWTEAGVTLHRREELRFLRATTPVAVATEIVIEATRDLTPYRVRWQSGGAHAEAVRAATGWTIVDGVDAALPAEAVPAELVPLIIRRRGAFRGTVFLPARGFVAGTGVVEAVAPARLVGRLALAEGTVAEATIDLADDRSYARVVDGEGVIAIKTTADAARLPYDLVDLVAATAVPIAGSGDRLVLDAAAVPPPLPGQLARATDDGIELVLSAALPGGLPAEEISSDRTGEIAQLVGDVRRRIAPDLGAGPASAAKAATATKGDCTTYALAYAAHAVRRAIPTRVVTGYRVDGERLVRHRWAVSWTGRAWIAIDVAFGAAPAGGDLVGLAVHGADDAGLVAGEAALALVRGARWR